MVTELPSIHLHSSRLFLPQGKGLDDPLRRFTKRTVDYGSGVVRWLEDGLRADERVAEIKIAQMMQMDLFSSLFVFLSFAVLL